MVLQWSYVDVRLNINEDVIERLYTSDDGEVIFDSLCTDEYWVRIAKDEYTDMEFEFDIGCNKVKEFVKFLAPE